MKKVYVYTKPQHEEMVILDSSSFETKNFCECYTNYGQQIGCYDASCHSWDNNCGGFIDDLAKELNKKFNLSIPEEYSEMERSEFIEQFEDIDSKTLQSISAYIDEYEEENEHHTEAEVFEFWDGSNFRSLILSTEYCDRCADLVELEDREADAILKEYEDVVFFDYNYGICKVETENYIFIDSQFAGSVGVTVEKK